MFLHLFRTQPIRYQIKVFLKWRKKKGCFEGNYPEWLYLFQKWVKKDDILDITTKDIEDFCDYIHSKESSKWRIREAEKCVYQLMRFYNARGKMAGNLADYQDMKYKKGVKFLSDVKRNRRLVLLRVHDLQLPPEKRKWSWRALGDEFGIHYTTARQIFYRDVDKYAPNI